MTATDVMRRMLDERGVEWWNQTDPEPQTRTVARSGDQFIIYHENVDGTVGYLVTNIDGLTPEQAIAATLGRGECRRKWHNGYGFCDQCGANITSACNVYCWQCGRKVVDDGH